jgi:hypothetical protein
VLLYSYIIYQSQNMVFYNCLQKVSGTSILANRLTKMEFICPTLRLPVRIFWIQDNYSKVILILKMFMQLDLRFLSRIVFFVMFLLIGYSLSLPHHHYNIILNFLPLIKTFGMPPIMKNMMAWSPFRPGKLCPKNSFTSLVKAERHFLLWPLQP